MPVTGLEPVRCRQRWILSPLRLPFHHTGSYISNGHPQKGHGEIGGPFRRSIKKLLDIQFQKSIAMQSLSLTAAESDELDFESTTSTIPSHRHGKHSIVHSSEKCKEKFPAARGGRREVLLRFLDDIDVGAKIRLGTLGFLVSGAPEQGAKNHARHEGRAGEEPLLGGNLQGIAGV